MKDLDLLKKNIDHFEKELPSNCVGCGETVDPYATANANGKYTLCEDSKGNIWCLPCGRKALDRSPQLEKVLTLARELERGCNCDYDHRCSSCQTVIDVRDEIRKVGL